MKDTLKKFKLIFSKSQIKKTILLLIVVLIGVLLEMLGIGLIIPILSILSDQGTNKFFDYEKFSSFFSFMNISNHRDLILISVYLLLIVYFLKTVFLAYSIWFQSKFINDLHSSISGKLFKNYLFQDLLYKIWADFLDAWFTKSIMRFIVLL